MRMKRRSLNGQIWRGVRDALNDEDHGERELTKDSRYGALGSDYRAYELDVVGYDVEVKLDGQETKEDGSIPKLCGFLHQAHGNAGYPKPPELSP